MVSVTVNKDDREVINHTGDYALAFIMSNLKKDHSTAVAFMSKGRFRKDFFYYLGRCIVRYIKGISSIKSNPEFNDLLDRLNQGIRDEINEQEVDHGQSNP